MDSKEWTTLLKLVRHQLDELHSALAQNEQAAKDARLKLKRTQQQLSAWLSACSDSAEALYCLSQAVESLNYDKLTGVYLLNSEGKILLHNNDALQFLSERSMNHFPTDCFFIDGRLIPSEDLPWGRCQTSTEEPEIGSYMMKHPNTMEELFVDATALPIHYQDEFHGALAMLRDTTEIIKAANFIKELLESAEKQLASIETAQRELQLFTAASPQSESTAADAAPERAKQTDVSQTNKVLIVDDVPVNQQLLLMRLHKFGVQADLASNGEEAVARCKRQRYALVFMDIDMPVLNGLDATAEIRKFESDKDFHTPIVALTGFDTDGDKRICLDSGMDDFVSKGDRMNRVRFLVDRYIFGRSNDGNSVKRTSGDDDAELKLDHKWLRRTYGEDTETLLSLFFGSATMLMNCLEYALKEEDLREVTHFAYSLKGPCSSIGATAMADKAVQLVADADQGNWVEAVRKYAALHDMLTQLRNRQKAQLSLPN